MTSLFGRVVLTNGLVFCLGTLVLALSPATVSRRVLVSEALVLAVGLALVVTVNALMLRQSLAPLDRLGREMAAVESPEAGRRLQPEGDGPVRDLITSFNAMLDRLDAERTGSNARALAAQEEERRRIAAELHDEIGQTLTAVLLELKRLADGAPPERRGDFEGGPGVRAHRDDRGPGGGQPAAAGASTTSACSTRWPRSARRPSGCPGSRCAGPSPRGCRRWRRRRSS